MTLDQSSSEGLCAAGRDITSFARSLCDCWRELCGRYLPVAPEASTWRLSRAATSDDPEQGWKLHVSANLLTACEVLRRVGPFLQRRRVLFKAPASLEALSRINSGIGGAYTQVGKFITVYPGSDREAVRLARQLHRLTAGLSAPSVPFDLEFRPGSSVYYRYGGFAHLEIKSPDGTITRAIRNPEGELIPDLIENEKGGPDWVIDPFAVRRPRRKAASADSPLKTTYKAFRALSQRGKGGVYQAIDFSGDPPRLCILKEGRSGGEVSWDGRDGHWRVRNEERVLKGLEAAGVKVPHVLSSFEVEGNYYLVTEFIEGVNLQTILSRRQKRLILTQVLRYGLELAVIISRIHAAGWAWRDCKPSNLVVTKKQELRPIDFEGACPIDRPDPLPWNTRGFSAPEAEDISPVQSRAPEDIYAAGATLYFLLTGRLMTASDPVPVRYLRQNVPPSVCDIISELLAPHVRERPDAQTMTDRLTAALSLVEHTPE